MRAITTIFLILSSWNLPSVTAASCPGNLVLHVNPAFSPDLLVPPENGRVRSWLDMYTDGANASGFEEFLAVNGVDPQTLNADKRKTWLAQFLYQKWPRWEQSQGLHRSAMRNLELRKISPPEEAPVFNLIVENSLPQISARNRARLLRELHERYPLNSQPTIEQLIAAEGVALEMRFEFIREANFRVEHGPILSPMEARKIGTAHDEFYSDLLDGSPSVEFEIFPAAPQTRIRDFMPRFAAVLNPQFASENGFVLPKLTDVKEIVSLFARWEPKTIEKLMRSSFASLPPGIGSVDEFLKLILEGDGADLVFPPNSSDFNRSLYVTLASLRIALHRYVLTEADGRAFIYESFKYFLLWTASTLGPEEFESRMSDWENPATATRLRNTYLEFIGWAGFSLHVPFSVPRGQFRFVARDEHLYPAIAPPSFDTGGTAVPRDP